MGWSHEDSFEVGLVVEVLEVLRKEKEFVNFETGDVRHRIDFTRERSIPKFHEGFGKRFDFSVLVDDGKFTSEFLIEVHGKQHYELSFLGDDVRESDRLKKQWAETHKVPLLVLKHSDVLSLYSESKLAVVISEFLGIKK